VGPKAPGALTDDERADLWLHVRQGLVNAWRDDYSVRTVADGVTDVAAAAVESLIAARVDAALGEVERRIDHRASEIGRTSAVGRLAGLCEAAQFIRDYRQEDHR
jgi:hypothetical protein